MFSGKTLRWSITISAFSLLLLAGCAKEVSTYKLTIDAQREVEYDGSLAEDPNLKGGLHQKKIEIIFTQQVQNINKKGNAITKITFKEIKYLEKNRDNLILDFDSSKDYSKDEFLANLIGQSYTIEVTPTGEVAEIVDIAQAREAVVGPPSFNKRAVNLIAQEAIKERHSTVVMPPKNIKRLKKDNKWSSTRTLSFGMMGPKSYEKIYTVKNVERQKKNRVAIIEMNAAPAIEQSRQNTVPEMVDNTSEYTGLLNLNLDTGIVEQYSENLKSEWIIVDPKADEKNQTPDAIKMTATRLYELDRID